MPEQINKKLVNYASILDDGTREQAIVSSGMPFIHPHIALMPDAHLGKGATVGSVIPTKGAVMPAAVGVDIGCGMIAHRTHLTVDDLADVDLSLIRKAIEDRVPVSAGKYNSSYYNHNTKARVHELQDEASDRGFSPNSYTNNWHWQLGTLGGGNHFIEVVADQDDRIWLFLHSGSRGIGNKIAQHHIRVAQELMGMYHITLPDKDLAYIPEGTWQFDQYVTELQWAQHFAHLNRAEMMERVEDAMIDVLKTELAVELRVNCHHNYTQPEIVFGEDIWVTRKGAIDARKGVWGLIPGSMGTRSYVVQGKGAPASLNSAPHGAGRVHSRTAARKLFDLDDLVQAMEGIEFRVSDAFVDEIPAAYKDIDVVMDDAKDLVEVKYELRQLVNVKGE